MNKIRIEGANGHVEISTRHEAEEINDVLQDLIVPALRAYGFAPDTIQDGFTEYCEDFSEERIYDKVDTSNVDWPVIDDLVQGMRDTFIGKPVVDRRSDEGLVRTEELCQCAECEKEFPESLINRGLCEDCYDTFMLCDTCGRETDNYGNTCSDCEEASNTCGDCGNLYDDCTCEEEQRTTAEEGEEFQPQPQISTGGWAVENDNIWKA